MKYLSFLVFFSWAAFSQSHLGQYPVDAPDIPDNGWYWAANDGGVGGWGVNIEVQQADFVESGQYLFGSFYTYDENNQPIWYTFSGEYSPEPDVYLWRFANGDMGSFTGEIYKSTGGSCLVCTPNPADSTEPSGLGQVVITWKNPFTATIRIGDTITHDVSRFNFHTGSLKYDVSFLTKGWWYFNLQTLSSFDGEFFDVEKGVLRFEQLDNSLFVGTDFYDENNLYYTSSDDSNLFKMDGTFLGSIYGDADSNYKLLVIYNTQTHKSMVSNYLNLDITGGVYHLSRCSIVIEGYFRPSKFNSVFYARDDDRCVGSELSTESFLKGSFAYFTYMGNAGGAIANNRILGNFNQVNFYDF